MLVLFNPDDDAQTYSVTNSRIMAAFVVGRVGLTDDDVAAWTEDLERLGHDGRYFFSRNRGLSYPRL